MSFKQFLMILLLLPALLTGRTLEIKNLRDILPLVDKDTLVLIDLDNTLIMTNEQLGWTTWFERQANDLDAKGMSASDSQHIYTYYWTMIQPKLSTRTVESDTAKVIQKLQDDGIPIVGFTDRKEADVDYTFKQLESVFIDLSKTAPAKERLELLFCMPVVYEDGVLFCTVEHKKSKCVLTFLKKENLNYKKIIYIDDKMFNIHDVQEALEEKGIEFSGIRYAGSDSVLREYDSQVAEEQWEAFPNTILSNEAALQIIEKKDKQRKLEQDKAHQNELAPIPDSMSN